MANEETKEIIMKNFSFLCRLGNAEQVEAAIRANGGSFAYSDPGVRLEFQAESGWFPAKGCVSDGCNHTSHPDGFRGWQTFRLADGTLLVKYDGSPAELGLCKVISEDELWELHEEYGVEQHNWLAAVLREKHNRRSR